MSMTVLLAHGWGGTRASLAPLAAALSARGHVVRAVEDGQFGAAPDWSGSWSGSGPGSGPGSGGPLVLCGHSAGFPALLARHGPRCSGAVAINGFTRLSAAADHPTGVPARVLARMAARVEQDPVGTLRAFRAAHAGAHPGPERPDSGRLRAALEELARTDQRQVLREMREQGTPVLALATTDDTLATPALTRACFTDAEIVWESGGHFLPEARPALCAERVAAFLRALPA